MRSFAVKRGTKSVPVSIVSAHEDLDYLAIGLYDGTLLLYKGNFSRERFGNRTPKVLYEAPADQHRSPITALAFRAEGSAIVLYFATYDRVWSCLMPGDEPPRVVHSFGSEVGASTSSDDGRFYAVIKEKDRDDDPVCCWFIFLRSTHSQSLFVNFSAIRVKICREKSTSSKVIMY